MVWNADDLGELRHPGALACDPPPWQDSSATTGAEHLDTFYADLLREGQKDGTGGLSRRTVAYIHVVIHRALKDAVRKRKLAVNVAELADPPRQVRTKPQLKVWTEEELRRFLAGVRIVQDELGRQVYLYVPTGAGVATELRNVADAYGEMDLPTLGRIIVPSRPSGPRHAPGRTRTPRSAD